MDLATGSTRLDRRCSCLPNNNNCNHKQQPDLDDIICTRLRARSQDLEESTTTINCRNRFSSYLSSCNSASRTLPDCQQLTVCSAVDDPVEDKTHSSMNFTTRATHLCRQRSCSTTTSWQQQQRSWSTMQFRQQAAWTSNRNHHVASVSRPFLKYQQIGLDYPQSCARGRRQVFSDTGVVSPALHIWMLLLQIVDTELHSGPISSDCNNSIR